MRRVFFIAIKSTHHYASDGRWKSMALLLLVYMYVHVFRIAIEKQPTMDRFKVQ